MFFFSNEKLFCVFVARVYVAVFNLSSDKQKRVASEGHFLSQAGKCAGPRQCQETCTKKQPVSEILNCSFLIDG